MLRMWRLSNARLAHLPGKSEVNPRAHCNVVSVIEGEQDSESERKYAKGVVIKGSIDPS